MVIKSMKTLINIIYLLAISTPLYASLFPEDGSVRLEKWYYGEHTPSSKRHLPGDERERLFQALRREGVKPVFIDEDYDYIQDLALFDNSGNLLLNADYPADEDILVSLTFGIAGVPDYGPLTLRKLTSEKANFLGISSRKMEWAFVEGGGVLSGQFANGEPYVIVGNPVAERVLLYYEYLHGERPSDEFIRNVLAKDFQILEKNLFILPLSSHLDLTIKALPGGVLLFDDPRMVSSVLEEVLTQDGVEDRARLRSIHQFYTTGYQQYFTGGPNVGQPMGSPMKGYSDFELPALDRSYEILKERFQVHRVAGVFNEYNGYSYKKEEINFLNGFNGLNQEGEKFFFTNRGPKALQRYWSSLLEQFGYDDSHIYYFGKYSSGAGLDCLGALGL